MRRKEQLTVAILVEQAERLLELGNLLLGQLFHHLDLLSLQQPVTSLLSSSRPYIQTATPHKTTPRQIHIQQEPNTFTATTNRSINIPVPFVHLDSNTSQNNLAANRN
jgi:hypothetical protein